MGNHSDQNNQDGWKNLTNKKIFSLIISGYHFENKWTNFLLNVFCGIPVDELIGGLAIMNLLSPVHEAKNDELRIDDEEAKKEHIFLPETPTTNSDVKDANVHTSLLFNSVFYKGQNNILYSKGKVGKSKLSMEVAKNPLIKRPAFILREDYNGGQLDSYKAIVGDKAMLITLRYWNDVDTHMKQDKANAIQREVLLRYTNSDYRKYQNISEQVFAKSGLKDGRNRYDDIAVFQAIVKKAITEGADFICLDSLNALIGEKTKITRTMMERIFEPMMGSGVTFLLIHHENAFGKIYGSVDLANSFDHIYHLNLFSSTSERDVLVLEEQSRNTESKRLSISRTWKENIPRYEVLADSIPNGVVKHEKTATFSDQIMDVLSSVDADMMLFDDLHSRLGNRSKGTLKNNLKELEEKGLVKKTDGKTWKSITNLTRLK
jgi:hypothetical protein